MVFSTNPLALSVPDPVFEAWLRDNRYLEILDDRSNAATFADHRNPLGTTNSRDTTTTTTTTTNPSAGCTIPAASSLLSVGSSLLSVLTLNPFSKLAANDFSGDTPAWTQSFLGRCGSYSWPTSPSQARMRVHENIKRYARNYSLLSLLIFACSLYQMPIALLGLISCLLMWDLFRICNSRWGLEKYPTTRQIMVYGLQCATAVILYCSHVQMALFCAICISYAAMLSHALLRKLTPSKQPTRANNQRRSPKSK